ncbi:hypothetical protein QUF70_12980 [Desulfobacterales bacterium HSG17]|nr:hypothetical protein [Desulfobacterales bacterium HSG17]
MVEKILRFESELCRADKIPVRLMAAALILSNKMIDKDRLKALWEDIKMLDIFEIAKEEGKTLGIQEGKCLGILENRREMLMETLIERFNLLTEKVSEQIRALQNPDVLKALFHQALRCQSLKEFEAVLKQVS